MTTPILGPIHEGAVVVFTHGEYDGYGLCGVGIATKLVDLGALHALFKQEGGARASFLKWLVARGEIRPIRFFEAWEAETPPIFQLLDHTP